MAPSLLVWKLLPTTQAGWNFVKPAMSFTMLPRIQLP